MANEIVPGGVGNVAVRVESSLGTSAASWQGIRCIDTVNISKTTEKLIANHVAGHRNPFTREKPEMVNVGMQDAFTIKSYIHRVSADGGTPIMATFLKSGGLLESVGPTAVATSTGTPAAGSIVVDDATGLVAGEVGLVELAGVYWPTLVAAVAIDTPEVGKDTITPSIALSAAQDGSTDVVELCHGFTPVTSTGYQVPATQTLQFRTNSLGYYNNAVADLSMLATGCALSKIGAIEFGPVGTAPTIEYIFHAASIALQEDDIAADSFTDSDEFVVINDDFQFAISDTNSGSGIATLITKAIKKVTFNPNFTIVPVMAQGSTTSVNGFQAYVMKPVAPTVTIDAHFDGDTDGTRRFFDELTGSNASTYIHAIQPTRNLDHPAFGVWMPNCHLAPGSEPSIDFSENTVSCQATFEASTAGWGAATDIDDVTSAPIVIGLSNEVA